MIGALVAALLAAVGTHWVYTALSYDWNGFGIGPKNQVPSPRFRFNINTWLVQAGLEKVDYKEFISVVCVLAVSAGLSAYVIFGSFLVSTVVAVFAVSFPVAGYRSRRIERRRKALEAWPQIIEEIRIQTSSMGRSIPQALFEVGSRSTEELRSAFETAHREWLLTTDLKSTLAVLKDLLADSTADVACETLLIAHELGGSDLDSRLETLAEDRRQEVQDRKDARSRQAGARFARMFVLFVPLGMAVAGMSIGSGRNAYQSPTGQLVVLAALFLIVGCWFWAGRIMRLPEPKRVFEQ